MKKIILYLMAIFTALTVATPEALANRLPDQLWEYIRKELPDSTQRFDSIIVVNKDVKYVPLFPAQRVNVESIKAEYSYPASRSLRQLPEVIIFNNNFTLMKITRNARGEYSMTSNEDLPARVKLGIMPQNMLVPPGLKIPENLKIVLGNLEIPVQGEGRLVMGKNEAEPGMLTVDRSTNVDFQPIKELANKKIYVTSNASKFMMVYDSTSKNPLYELKLSALPAKILASNSTKFALITYFGQRSPEVADLRHERIISKLPMESIRDADLDTFKNLAYLSSPQTNEIHVVDLESARLIRTIKLAQAPTVLGVSSCGTRLAFLDGNTQDVWYVELSGEYNVRRAGHSDGASKILFDQNKIFAVSRVKNKMHIYDISNEHEEGVISSKQKLCAKPTDALLHKDKIYILCSDAAVVSVFDIKTSKMDTSLKLQGGGFYSRITRVPNSKNALITGIDTGKYQILDLENARILRTQPFEVMVSNITIIEK
jgi:hypothetical protein